MNGRPIPRLRLDDLSCASMPPQSNPYSRYCSSQLSPEQISQPGNDEAAPSIFNCGASQSSSAQVEGKSEEKTQEEGMGELEKDVLLTFEDQEKLSSTASGYPVLCRYSPGPPQLEPDQKHNCGSPTNNATEGGQSSAFGYHG